MSDATNQDQADFRGTRETKRRDETVMLGSDAMAAMVDQATAAPAAPSDSDESSNLHLIVMAGVGVLLAIVVIALVLNYVS